MRPHTSIKAAGFAESVIREMSRVGTREGDVNLTRDFPDFPAPLPMKEAAKRAIEADKDQYAATWGSPALHSAIARRAGADNGIVLDPKRNVTVCCGATVAFAMRLLRDSGVASVPGSIQLLHERLT